LYVVKARFLKHSGDLASAAELTEKARQLDLADRYLNTKSTKYLLRANQVEQADRVIALFTKEPKSQNTNLYEMQCMWYEQEIGNAYFRLGQYGKALKKYVAIEKHYADILEDQYDFHQYCLKKGTIRNYINLLKFEDKLHGTNAYLSGISSIIKTYLKIYNTPKTTSVVTTAQEKMDEKERKKLEAKKKKEEMRRLAEEANKKEDINKKGKAPVAVDPDPDGETLLKVDTLAELTKYLNLIIVPGERTFNIQLLVFDTYETKGKLLLALKALKKAVKLSPDNPELHKRIMRYLHTFETVRDKLTPVIKGVIETEFHQSIVLGKTAIEYNEIYHSKFVDSLIHNIAVAESLYLIDPSKKQHSLELLNFNIAKSNKAEDHFKAYELLKGVFGEPEKAEKYKELAAPHFPSYYFFHAVPQPVANSSTPTTEATNVEAQAHQT